MLHQGVGAEPAGELRDDGSRDSEGRRERGEGVGGMARVGDIFSGFFSGVLVGGTVTMSTS